MIIGPEDLVKYGKNTIITGSQDFLTLFHKLPASQVSNGNIFAIYQADQIDVQVKKLEIQGFPSNIAFHPHGLSEFKDILYVINHAYDKGGERIEALQIQGNNGNYTLKYLFSILFQDSFLGSLNDLLVINDNQLLITTYTNFPDSIKGKATGTYKDFLKFLKTAFFQIIKYKNTFVYNCAFNKNNQMANCQAFQNTISGMNNGIDWDKKDVIAVSKPTDKMVSLYKFQNNKLELISNVYIGKIVDNLWYNELTDSFFVGSFIKGYEYYKYQLFYNESTYENQSFWGSVDEIYKPNKNESNYQVKNILIKRNAIKGLSGSIIIGDNLYLASWTDKSVVVCRKVI